MSTKDQVLSAELHGEALLTARRPELQPLIDHLREVAQGRDDIRVECAGTIAGTWFSSTARRGEDLIAAGLLMLAGPVDLDELDRWMRTGWGRRRGADLPYGAGILKNVTRGVDLAPRFRFDLDRTHRWHSTTCTGALAATRHNSRRHALPCCGGGDRTHHR